MSWMKNFNCISKLISGIITDMRVTHATPAALYAHTQSRKWESDSDIPQDYQNKGCLDIAKQLITSDVGKKINLVFGGGKRNFVPVEEEKGTVTSS